MSVIVSQVKPWEYPPPPVLFKYLPPERLNVLTECRVRFSQRTAFEDDHELQPDHAIFGTQDEIWRYAISIGFQLSRGGLPASVVVNALATDLRYQRLAIENMRRNTTVKDDLGCFCLTEAGDSDRMWREYAGSEKGFVVGYAHAIPSSQRRAVELVSGVLFSSVLKLDENTRAVKN